MGGIHGIPDDVLELIVFLLPSPAHLIRAAVCCRRWHGVVAGPGFLRRFVSRDGRRHRVAGSYRDGRRCFGCSPKCAPGLPRRRQAASPSTSFGARPTAARSSWTRCSGGSGTAAAGSSSWPSSSARTAALAGGCTWSSATPSRGDTWRSEAPRPQRSRLNHVLITEASLRYNTCYIKWSPKSYIAIFNPYTSKVTTQSYRK